MVECASCHNVHLAGRTDTPPESLLVDPTNTAQVWPVYWTGFGMTRGNISTWCGKCHGTPDPAADHPIDRAIFGSLMADYATWVNVTLPRVPTDSPNDIHFIKCASCHK